MLQPTLARNIAAHFTLAKAAAKQPKHCSKHYKERYAMQLKQLKNADSHLIVQEKNLMTRLRFVDYSKTYTTSKFMPSS